MAERCKVSTVPLSSLNYQWQPGHPPPPVGTKPVGRPAEKTFAQADAEVWCRRDEISVYASSTAAPGRMLVPHMARGFLCHHQKVLSMPRGAIDLITGFDVPGNQALADSVTLDRRINYQHWLEIGR